MTRIPYPLLRVCLVIATMIAPSIAAPAAAAEPAAEPAAGSAGAGFIHATVTWPSGESKSGYLRWKDEEAFWDDLFHSGYVERRWGEYIDREELRRARRAEYYRTHGLIDRIAFALSGDKEDPLGSRRFVSRFGDLQSIEIHDGDNDFVVTADGARHEIGGYANDAGSRLLLYEGGSAEPEEIRWNDLSGIVFTPAPADLAPYAERLYGRLETTAGDFEGYIQWDQSECTSIDVLDGDEGTRDAEVTMGGIRAISRARDNSADLEMRDGARRNLHGSNDVGSGNRGIMVEVEGLGRVTVPWGAFTRLTFEDGRGTGPARATYDNAAPLRGTLEKEDGARLQGRLVLDLDEAFAWDLLNAQDGAGFDWDVPLALVRTIEPQHDDSSRITLVSGRVLELKGTADVGEGNGGVLVFSEPDAAVHVPWSEVRRIDLDW